MLAIPSPHDLALLVSGVTETMFGFSFALEAPPSEDIDPESWRTASVEIGKKICSVAIASDTTTSKQLGSFMFGLEPNDVDQGMAEDALREMANIVAGRVKGSLGVDAALGLPILRDKADVAGVSWREATLRGNGRRAVVWVGILGADQAGDQSKGR